MKTLLAIIGSIFFLISCDTSYNNANTKTLNNCNYTRYHEFGNKKIDTINKNKKLIDPIDDNTNFTKTSFDFMIKNDKIYKKSKTREKCNSKLITVEYYQDLTQKINLDSYYEYNDIYFSTNDKVYFWWSNSDGHLIIPIPGADAKTFKPFEDICGGTDSNNVYYGCPNRGVYKLDISKKDSYSLIAKDNSYWNNPNHYVIINDSLHDVKYEFSKGYFCQKNTIKTISEIQKK